MRMQARIDKNQPDIVAAFRKIGCTVQHLHVVGNGCPDIIVGIRGKNILVEIKDGDKPPSARALTADESRWHKEWRGSVHIVESIEDVETLVALVAL